MQPAQLMGNITISLLVLVTISFGLSALSLVLQTGEQTVITTKGNPSVTVSNPQAVKVITGEHQIHVIARQPGRAEVFLDKPKQKIKVTVYGNKVGETRNAVLRWMKDVEGISLETLPDKIYLHGTAYSLEDWTSLEKLKSLYQKTLVSDVSPSQKNWDAPKHEIELKPMLEVEILIAEVKKNSFHSLGFKFPPVYSATVLPSSDLSSASFTFNPMPLELHAGLSKSNGRVLANPKLLCRSGETAHFVAGGEIPIKIMSWKNSDVVWKRYGVILDITPLVDFNEGISTKISTEISLLDPAHKVDGIPGLLTNKIDTHFDLRGSKTIALSGLIKSEVGHNTNGLSLLGEIPILGELFKSRDYQENRTELIIFVTPRVISPEAPPAPTPDLNWWTSEEHEQ